MNTDFNSWIVEVEGLIHMQLADHEKDYCQRFFNAQLTPHEASCFMMRESDF